jgi:tetratricopeptide (TPR) repeat protein
MKHLVALTLLAGCASAASPPVNERVMYGGVFKSSEMRLADERFLEAARRDFPTARAASDHYAELGWTFLRKQDRSTAIKRFNQCWLLDGGNPACFWGFGMFEQQIGQTDQSVEHLEKARGMWAAPPVDFQIDLAIAYVQKSRQSSETAIRAQFLAKAERIFESAAAAEPDNQKVPCVWADALLYLDQPKRACQVVDRCKDDRDGVHKRLTCP